MKRRTKKLIKRFSSGALAITLSVALNINPLAALCGAVADSGIIDKFGILRDNLIYVAENKLNKVDAEEKDEMEHDMTSINETVATIIAANADVKSNTSTTMTDTQLKASIAETLSDADSSPDYTGILGQIKADTGAIRGYNKDINKNMQSGFNAVRAALMGESNSIHADLKSMHGMINQHFGVVEEQLSHISEQLDMINDNIDSMQHNYRVAHLYSLNAEYDNALWRPYTDDVPYVKDFAQVMGQFASVYTGYWDTAITEMNRPGNSKAERALEVLGYDAIVRFEGVCLIDEIAQNPPVTSSARPYRVSVLGDSISTFEGEVPGGWQCNYPGETDVQDKNQTWWGKMIDDMGFEQCGISSYSGSLISNKEGVEPILYGGGSDRINALKGNDGSDPDIVIIYLGVNDLLTHVTDMDYIKQSYETIITNVQTAYPNCYTFCCTLPPVISGNDSTKIWDQDGVTYEDYNNVIIDAATAKQCPLIDFSSAWELSETRNNCYDRHIHPNAAGMELLAKKAVEGLQSANVTGKIGGESSTTKAMNIPKGQSGEHESYDITGNSSPNSLAILVQEFIPENEISWLDAVTVLYKALGQYLYTYQTFMTHNAKITPETSPAYEGFSNIVPDEQGYYNGYDFYMFLNRSNLLYGVTGTDNAEPQSNPIYWTKALNEQFVSRKQDMDDPITASEFYILATKMMQAYGEPVINQDEIKALLQVYGSNYPVTLGFEVADAWAYLKVRGCLNEDIVPSGYLTRDQLLDICMCIADPDSRSDYKNINVVLDLSDVLRDNGYYPAYDLDFSVGAFQATDEIDYTKMDYYTYLIAKQDGWELGETGMLRVYTSPKIEDGKEYPDATCMASTMQVGEDEFYVVNIPNDKHKGFSPQPAYICMCNAVTGTVVKGDVEWFEIPNNAQRGGLFLGGYTKSSNGDVAVVSVQGSCWRPFDYRSADSDLIRFNDAMRAGKTIDGYSSYASNASNATLKEKLLYAAGRWFEPMRVQAAEADEDTDVNLSETTTILFSDDGITKKSTSEFKSSAAGSLTSSYSVWDVIKSGYSNEDGANAAIDSLQNKDEAKKINVADTGETLILNRLWWISNVNQMNGVYPSGHADSRDMYTFADAYYSGRIVTGASNTDQGSSWSWASPLKDFLNGNPAPGVKSGTIIPKLSGNVTVTIPNNMVLLCYALGVMPMPHMNECKSTSRNTEIKFGKTLCRESNVLSGNNSDELASDIKKLLQNTSNIEEKIKVARSEYKTTVTVIENGYKITATDARAVSDLIGSCAVGDISQLATTVASTAVMNRNEQIMISWSDLLAAGVVYPTKEGGQPKKHEDGAYYFMTANGQVMVNDEKHTIQVGTTIYDLAYKQNNGTSPKLVYIDTEQNNEIYFDIRSVMGMITTTFTRNNTKTMILRNTLGQGEYATYELSAGNWSADGIYMTHMLCYNFPEISENDFAATPAVTAGDGSYTVDIVRYTSLDGAEYPITVKEDNTVEKSITYWENSDRMRYLMSSFSPTANWITVIDDDGANFEASVFVYYPKVVFEDGFMNTFNENPESTLDTVKEPKNAKDRWKDLSTKLSEAAGIKNSSNQNVNTMIMELYDIDSIDDNTPWYIKMSIDAIVDLYLLTGKYYVSPDYIVREFRITDNSCTMVEAYDEYSNITKPDKFPQAAVNAGEEVYLFNEAGNEVGAIYWLEGVGFVYNLPTVEEFNLADYFSGRYPLPLAYDDKCVYKTNSAIINYNMNYYGKSIKTGNVQGARIPYGCVLSSAGYIHYTHTDVDKKILKGYEYDALPKAGEENDGMLTLPYLDTSSDDGILLAPSGIYFSFGGNAMYTTAVKYINDYNTRVNKFYYGNSRIGLNKSNASSSTSTFNFVSALYNPISIGSEEKFNRVWQGVGSEAYIARNSFLEPASSDAINEVISEDWLPNALADWLIGLGSNDLITAIDQCSSMLILFAFYVLPIIGIMVMTILVGLSFIGDNKVVQYIVSKTFDPIRILTVGNRNIHTWKWNKVIIPCILLYTAFALFLRGNIIRIIMFLANWYDSVMHWAKAVF